MGTDSDHDFEIKNRELRRQNRRYRELIEILSSQAGILREKLDRAGLLSIPHRVFESLAQGPEPSNRPLKQTPIALEAAPTPLKPPLGWKCLAADGGFVRLGFTLFGMDREQIANAVDAIERRQLRSRNFAPVFVTDLPWFEAFRERGYVVEYIPPAFTQATEQPSAEHAYLEQRLELIKVKWGLSSYVDLS